MIIYAESVSIISKKRSFKLADDNTISPYITRRPQLPYKFFIPKRQKPSREILDLRPGFWSIWFMSAISGLSKILIFQVDSRHGKVEPVNVSLEPWLALERSGRVSRRIHLIVNC